MGTVRYFVKKLQIVGDVRSESGFVGREVEVEVEVEVDVVHDWKGRRLG